MRKKISGILVGIICLFMFPLFVFADIGMPTTVEYDVRVSNKDGALVYDYNGKATSKKLPYDAKLTVIYEYTTNKEKFASVRYEKNTYEIKLEDVEVFSKDVDLSKFNKQSTPRKLYVFGDCYLYAGPSTLYGHVDGDVKIPVDTIIEYEYSDDLWAYTEYNGVKGWVYKYTLVPDFSADIKANVAIPAEKGSKLYVVDKVDSLLVSPYADDKIDVDISAGEEITYDYYVTYPKEYSVHVKVDKKEGWLKVTPSNYYSDTVGGAFLNDCSSLFVFDNSGATIYKKGGDLSSSTSDKIPYGEIVSIKYDFVSDYYQWYKVVYKDKEVWINEKVDDDSTVKYLQNYGKASVYIASKDLEVYDKVGTGKKTIKTIKKDESFQVSFTTYADKQNWGYIDTKDIKGWVSLKDLRSTENVEFCVSHLRVEEFEENEEEKKKNSSSEDDESEGLTKKEIIILAVGGAATTALVAGTSIAIVNKKKKGI